MFRLVSKCGWRRHQHVLLDGFLEQSFVRLQRLDESRLDGHEHKDHLRRIQPRQVKVAAVRELFDTLPNGCHVLGKRHASLGIVLGIDVTGVRVERDLGIDDQVLALRRVNDHIGALAIDFTGEADLPLEVLAVD